MSRIVPLNNVPPQDIERLLDAAFGTDRHGRTAYLIRDGMPWLPALSVAMLTEGGELAGSLQCWPVALTRSDGSQKPLIMVGPVAVAPEHQGTGLGRAMMDAVVATARTCGTEPLMMIGDPEYYGRFWGFSAEGTAGWSCPGPYEPRRLLALPVDGSQVDGQGMLGPRRSPAI
ncbi:N-acetyltransferase GCN5 [Sphingomonas paucimobilis]|nr:N-acetyltransferase GCN5 [Sphingomonas paucimobilis]